MILGQKLKNAALQLGNKSIGALHTMGNKINPVLSTIETVINNVNQAKKIYSNLEKFLPHKKALQ
jgi:hypothetical protein